MGRRAVQEPLAEAHGALPVAVAVGRYRVVEEAAGAGAQFAEQMGGLVDELRRTAQIDVLVRPQAPVAEGGREPVGGLVAVLPGGGRDVGDGEPAAAGRVRVDERAVVEVRAVPRDHEEPHVLIGRALREILQQGPDRRPAGAGGDQADRSVLAAEGQLPAGGAEPHHVARPGLADQGGAQPALVDPADVQVEGAVGAGALPME